MMDKPHGPLIYTIRKGADVVPRRVFYPIVAVLIVGVLGLGLALSLGPH
jgi:hypothetical protein